jgi:hypothetical protein
MVPTSDNVKRENLKRVGNSESKFLSLAGTLSLSLSLSLAPFFALV